MILPFETETQVRAAAAPVRAQLDADRLIAYPTETVYGLGSAPRDSALTPLAQLKGRPARKPFLLLVSGRLMAEEWGLVFPPAARAMADYFWPGPLTLVLILSVFASKYAFGFLHATRPDLFAEPRFWLTELALSGVLTGMFVGRFAGLWRQYRAAPHEDLA